MNTMGHRNQKRIGLPQVILQMAASAFAFTIVLGIMALAMPLWHLVKQLISYGHYHRMEDSVAPLVVEHGPDMRTAALRESQGAKAYYRMLCHLLTEGVQGSFKEQHDRPTLRISELIQQLDQTPGPMSALGH